MIKEIKYPKFILFIITVFLAYYFYQVAEYGPLHEQIIELKLVGAFIAGLFYTYGFTTAFSIAIFLVIAQSNNIVAAAILGGLGALISDFIIFEFIRKAFSDEIVSLSHEKIIVYINKKVPNTMKKYLIPVLSFLIIASPLPDEIGVGILATIRKLSVLEFILVSFLGNMAGIFIILTIGSLI